MSPERAWVLRLVAALGGIGTGVLPAACTAESSCPADEEPTTQSACFTKQALADSANGTGSAGAPPLDSCPDTTAIVNYPIANERIGGATIEAVREDGESCCYRYYYPCEGRPLVDGNELLVAETIPRSDWVRSAFTAPRRLEQATRMALSRAWARDAAFEHASVAAFSRFVLELLSLGAPLDLVSDAERAVADEIQHAELCYGLASRYAGERLGPGNLAMPAFAPRSLREAALASLNEGCISETIAAHGARERLKRATDPAVAAVLERIVEDEQRHAELSFRFLRWALDRQPGLAREAERAFATAMPAPDTLPDDPNVDAEILRSHGVLTRAERRASAERAIRNVITPCYWALKGQLRAS